MNKLTEIIYRVRLNHVKDVLKSNTRKIESAIMDNDYLAYNKFRLEQLRLMSCKSYLENKLSYTTN